MAELAPDLMPTVAAKKDKFVWELKIMIAYDIKLTIESETSTYGQVISSLEIEQAKDQS